MIVSCPTWLCPLQAPVQELMMENPNLAQGDKISIVFTSPRKWPLNRALSFISYFAIVFLVDIFVSHADYVCLILAVILWILLSRSAIEKRSHKSRTCFAVRDISVIYCYSLWGSTQRCVFRICCNCRLVNSWMIEDGTNVVSGFTNKNETNATKWQSTKHPRIARRIFKGLSWCC